MASADELLTNLLMQQQIERDEEERRRKDEEQRQHIAQQELTMRAVAPQQQGSQGGGINPMQFMDKFGGASSGGGGNAALDAWTGMGPSGGASSGGASSGSSLASFGPWAALAAAIVGNEANATHEGRRQNDSFFMEEALKGRALYEDKDHLREQGNKIIPGLGEDINIAGNLSSPLDMFDGDTWQSAWDSAKKGGMLGGIFRSIF